MKGHELIKSHLAEAPTGPGVYRMLNEHLQIIYIGKAKNLKRRLSSYARKDLRGKVNRMIWLTCYLEYSITSSEAEALLLEAQLIKKHQPKFNILLKDDKSFPYIKLRLDHDYPQLIKYRGKNFTGGKFFGPFASAYQVDLTIAQLQKIFKLRPCSDSYFESRQRPCLQYQIGKCYGPCVGKISKENYTDLTKQVEAFLSGKTNELQENLASKMQILSDNMQFEEAAQIRDRIKALSYIQLKSGIVGADLKDADVIAVVKENNYYCIQAFLYRAGSSLGNKAYFPIHTEESNEAEVLSSFLGQFYQTRSPAKEILLNHEIEGTEVITEAIKQLHGYKVSILIPKRGGKLKLLQNAEENAVLALKQHLKNSTKNYNTLKEVKHLFDLVEIPERIEVYDNSHIMGAFAVGGMIVATPFGFDKKEYRLYTIKQSEQNSGPIVGDDYAMLRQVLTRRFLRLQKEPEKAPGLMIIDGGKGHMGIVKQVMEEYGITVPFVCMSKGVDRNAGREQFHIPGREVFTLDKGQNVMKYLQILRDEVHNYAIKGHRHKRSKAIKISSLDDIKGIGKKRKSALLNYFGSFQSIVEASAEDLTKAEGINKNLADNIYAVLHPDKIANNESKIRNPSLLGD